MSICILFVPLLCTINDSQYLTVPACQSIPFGWWWEMGWSRDRACFYWVHWGMKKFCANMGDTYYFFYMALLSWIHHFCHLLIFFNPKYLFASKSFLVTVLLFVGSSFWLETNYPSIMYFWPEHILLYTTVASFMVIVWLPDKSLKPHSDSDGFLCLLCHIRLTGVATLPWFL